MPKAVEPIDPFMELLTDALRAGPGSPEWHQALIELKKQGGPTAGDEYQVLWTARERLASGKDYRSVRPGAGFTRRLMDGIDRMPAGGNGPRRVSAATIIAVASIAILLAVVATVAYWIYTATPPQPAPSTATSSATVAPTPGLA